MNTGKLILEVNNSFSLFSDMLLVIIRLISDLYEKLINVFHGRSTTFNIGHSLSCVDPVRNNLFLFYLSLIISILFVRAQVVFITDYDNWCHEVIFLRLVHLNALEEIIAPAFNTLIAFAAGKIEHYDATIGSSVEGITKTLESLLASSIPNLKRNNLSRVNFDLLLDEICSDCWLLVHAGLLVLVAFNYGGLPYTRVANDYNLQKLFIFTRS